MDFIIDIIANAENSFSDWMMFVLFALVAIGAILGAWCWIGEKIIKIFNLGDKLEKLFKDE